MNKFGKAGKLNCPVCQSEIFDFDSFSAKSRKKLNLKI
jgi:uncharacterized Zn finger protein (UPF0148 family)